MPWRPITLQKSSATLSPLILSNIWVESETLSAFASSVAETLEKMREAMATAATTATAARARRQRARVGAITTTLRNERLFKPVPAAISDKMMTTALILLLPAIHAFALSTPGIALHRPPPRAIVLAADSPPPPPPSPPVFSGRDGGDDDENENSINPSLLFAAALSQIRRMPSLLPAALFALYRPFRRAVRTQMSIMPIILRLKLFEKQRFSSDEERLAARDTLDEVLATRFANFIASMRGAFVKAAQVLGSLEPSPVRPAYLRKIEPMTDSAPGGRPWWKVKRQLNRELRLLGHSGMESVFREFDREPIGTASVGQVHRRCCILVRLSP